MSGTAGDRAATKAPAVAVSRRVAPTPERPYVQCIGLHIRESNGVRTALVWLTKEQAGKLAWTLMMHAGVRP